MKTRSLRELISKDDDGAAPADAPVIGAQSSVLEAARLLAGKRCEVGRVVDGQGVVGIVSIYDLVEALPTDPQPAAATTSQGAESKPAVVLEFRRMDEGQRMLAEFESVEDAKTWLAERPQFVEVLGVEEPKLDPNVDAALRAAMRPLDDEELAKIEEVDRALERQHSIELQRMQEEAEAEAHPYTASTNPNRPMRIVYEKGKGLRKADASDDREISEVARDAALAWVKQRNEWMHPRRRHVGGAILTIWPGPIPGGEESDRIQPGPEVEVLPGFAPESET